MDILSLVFSTPFNEAPGLRFAYLFAQDLWLYCYDKEDHGGAIILVFNTTATVSTLKFMVFERFLHWQKYKDSLPISDYIPFTREKFV